MDWGGCFGFRADEYTEEHNTDVAAVRTEIVLTATGWNTDTALISAGVTLAYLVESGISGIYNEF